MSAPELRVITVRGEGVIPWLDSVAALRVSVFREFPYLYDGDSAYERRYLRTYADHPSSFVVLALAGTEVVGASTAVVLREADAAFREPLENAGHDPDHVVYFGESVLKPEWRGRGLGHEFFDERESYARAVGATLTCFCAVDRAEDDVRRPEGYRALDGFWAGRGYTRRDDLKVRFPWKTVGHETEIEHTLTFWVRQWHAH